MAKREFIDVDIIKDLLSFNLYNAEMKLIKLDGLCNIKAITEQDIVKPYLDKILKEIGEYIDTVDSAISDDELFREGLKVGYTNIYEFVDNLLSEQGDTK